MEYQAIFGINCGVSSGLGTKLPDYVRKTKKISADSPKAAYQNAMATAGKFADAYLSDPDTGVTTVQLLSLIGQDGDVSFDASKSVVKRSMLEHILALASESEPDE